MSEHNHLLRSATAFWQGNLSQGKGNIDLTSGSFEGQPYSFHSRFEDELGESQTNPEELLAAAHASCYSMQLSHFLAEAGHPPQRVETKCEIRLDKANGGFQITSSMLIVTAVVPDMDKEDVLQLAEKAKEECPMSKVLKPLRIGLELHVPNR